MDSINIREAKRRLSKIVARAAEGECVIIVKAGKPVAKITAYNAPAKSEVKRIGFLAGEFQVPDDFDRMGEEVF